MREKVLHYIREKGLLRAGDRVVVAVSGGADSVALLRLLLDSRADIGIVPAVAHFNHGLRGEAAQADEAFVAELAKQHAVEFLVARADVRNHAVCNKLSIEAAARELRYQWLTQLAAEQRFDAIATAHTGDDQAETVLLKFLRGAGTRGLAGIYPIVKAKTRRAKDQVAQERPDNTTLGPNPEVRIVRPLLEVSRAEIEGYLTSIDQPWREDESNLDRRFLRNRVRHDLLPLLEREYNPNLRSGLGSLAEVSRAEEEYWQDAVSRELEAGKAGQRQLVLSAFPKLPLALQRRLLRAFAQSAGLTLDFEHLERLLQCALGELRKVELPGGWLAERRQNCLELRLPEALPGAAYECPLPVPGEVHIAELGITVRAVLVPEEFADQPPGGELLNAEVIGADLLVRNWRPGDRFWPDGCGSEEKLKRLFAEKHIPAQQRPTWPIGLSGGQIVWVRGFPVSRSHAWKGVGIGVQIEVIEDGAASPPPS